MPAAFADTSYYLALLSPDDDHHTAAVNATSRMAGDVVTTSWILVEIANALRQSNHARGQCVALIEALRSDPGVRIFGPTAELFDAGFDLFSRRADKQWSLTDCISFVVMNDEGLREALTADRHFEQAGFTALLK